MSVHSDALAQAIAKHGNTAIPVQEQQDLGKPQPTAFSDEHAHFLETVLRLIDEKKIRTIDPQSIINQDVYASLDDAWRGKVDQALPNIISYLDKIIELHLRPEHNHSFEMKDAIESLWQTKQRIEEYADVFIF